MTSRAPAPMLSFAFARAFWVTARPYLFFVSGVSALEGLAFSPPLSMLNFIAVFVPLFLSYGLGQALTDVSQVDTDSISAPYRPLVTGEVSGRQVLAVSVAGLTFCGAVLAACSVWTLPIALVSVGGLATYTYFKRRWWAGPLWNAAIVGLLPLLAATAGGLSPAKALRSTPLLFGVASVTCGYATFVILGYLKDVEADRTSGYCTLPVRFGRRASVLASAFCGVLTLCFSGAAMIGAGHEARLSLALVASIGFWLVGVVSFCEAHRYAWRTTRDDQAYPAVAASVRGFVCLHAGDITCVRPGWGALAFALAVGFEFALRARPDRSQI